MDLLIKGGTIVTAKTSFQADVAVKDGKIAAIGADLPADGAEVVDATGKLVLPGALDGHTHMYMPFGGTISTDDYYDGTIAAACGGTTTIFNFETQAIGQPMEQLVEEKLETADKQGPVIDYSLHVGVGDVTTKEMLKGMDKVQEMGISSFKVFMVYDFGVDDGQFYSTLTHAAEIGALVGVHAENNDVNKFLVNKYLEEGHVEPWYHYMSKNEAVAGEADVRAINLAKMAGTSLYIVHLDNAQGVKAVADARAEGYPIFAETCPQYLYFTKDVYKDGKPEVGLRPQDFVCSPPMKGQESQDALWNGIRTGVVSTLATDHCPFLKSEKDWGITKKDGTPGNFTTIPNGCAGVENMYPYILSEANKGRITFNKAVEISAYNPAKLFGVDYCKGAIEIGKDADIVVYDPNKDFTIKNAENQHGSIDHTVWEGVELKGYPCAVYSHGNLVFDGKDFVGKKGAGKFVKQNHIHFDTPEF
ncbi:MAG: dihydropyrimidinase [Eubacteriales bacterium]|jgi:dihydropyrimidinase|nr:dihydropyrimidinase [Eubacteriales bacterium]